MDSTSRKKAKDLDKVPITMKYNYQGQTYASKLDDGIKWVTDIEVGHIEFEDITKQLAHQKLDAPHRRIKRSGLVEATMFPESVQASEFIMIVSQFYDPNTKRCVDDKG